VLEHAATEIDPTLARPTQAARQQALGGTQDIEKKLVQHLKRRQETELAQLARARTAIVPNGKPQERVLTVAPFLARYGPGLLPDLMDAFRAWYRDALEAPSQPALIHGDCWSGNVLVKTGRIAGFIDPAIHWAHPEIELAFGTLFGPLGEAFFARYRDMAPLAPGFFEARRDLYNLYPLLVHVQLFGGGYVNSVAQTLEKFGV